MQELQSNVTTIIFVTYNLVYLKRLCRRTIFLNHGVTKSDGLVEQVIAAYRDHYAYEEHGSQNSTNIQKSFLTSSDVDILDPLHVSHTSIITEVSFGNIDNGVIKTIRTGEGLRIVIK